MAPNDRNWPEGTCVGPIAKSRAYRALGSLHPCQVARARRATADCARAHACRRHAGGGSARATRPGAPGASPMESSAMSAGMAPPTSPTDMPVPTDVPSPTSPALAKDSAPCSEGARRHARGQVGATSTSRVFSEFRWERRPRAPERPRKTRTQRPNGTSCQSFGELIAGSGRATLRI